MKSKETKRTEAIARAKKYTYANSRAKRRGISEETWRAANERIWA